MKLYCELSEWYSLLTPVEEYVEEAGFFRSLLREALGPGRHTLLELGAGAGHNAHYLAEDFEITLTDLSPAMLELAAVACPTARRVVGDMREIRLNQTFDAVFVHDAIVYMLTPEDLKAVFDTAFAHLRPGGVLLLAPDCVAETFAPEEDCGGSDGEGRSMRYLSWSWQRPGEPFRAVTDYVLVTRVGEDLPVVYQDRHEEGVFPRALWLELLTKAGFTPENRLWEHSDVGYPLDIFLGKRV